MAIDIGKLISSLNYDLKATHAHIVIRGYNFGTLRLWKCSGRVGSPEEVALSFLPDAFSVSPSVEIRTREIMSGEIREGILHIPDREMTVSFLREKFESVPIPWSA